jgi:hypothetical protein
MSATRRIAKVATTQFTIYEVIYVCNLRNYVATSMQLHKQQCVHMAMMC